MSNKYAGWTNWDTWNANLWLSNEESIYHTMRAMVADIDIGKASDYLRLAMSGADLIDSIGNPDNIDYTSVNWSEIADAFRD